MSSNSTFCERAPELLGFTDPIQSCQEMMPELFHIYAPGSHGFAGYVVLHQGAPVAERGLEVGLAWLERTKLSTLEKPRAFLVAKGLESVGALPPGFSADNAADTEVANALTVHPFRLELIGECQAQPKPGWDLGGNPGGNHPGRIVRRRAVLAPGDDGKLFWKVDYHPETGEWTSEIPEACR